MRTAAVAAFVLIALMANELVRIYGRGTYACPVGGARNRKRHTATCPWNREP